MAEIKYNHAFGRLHAGIDLEIPLDRTIKTDISAQAKVDFDNYFVAANFPKIASTVSFLDFNSCARMATDTKYFEPTFVGF